MKALVEKEIRLLLPAFAGAIVLAIVPVWLFPYDRYTPRDYSIYFFCFGVALLALSTFGREIGLKTLPFLLAQPLERARVWRTKAAVLGFFVAMTFDGWWLSGKLFTLHQPLASQDIIQACEWAAVLAIGAIWMTLLLRQVAAAFWLTFLIPMVTVIVVQALGGSNLIVFMVLAIYAVAGVLLARRQFAGLQDTAWTGGFVTLASRRAVTGVETSRERRPWGTLIRKELKLQEFTLAGMAGLFVVHVGVVFLRKLGAASFGRTTLSILEMFGVIWMFVPLVAGSQGVADERQLGILDGLLCLPFSRRVQFWMKLIFVLVVGGLLSAVLQHTAESIGHAIGAGKMSGFAGTDMGFKPSFYCYLALSLASFWASTLTRSVVQAMAAGVVTSLAFFGIYQLGMSIGWRWVDVGFPSLLVAVVWLAYGNFRWVFESGRRWRRNVFGVSGTVVITLALQYAVFFRIWEFAMPVDGAHGPLRLSPGKPLAVHGYGGTGLAVVLPDGRLWTDRIAYDGSWLSLAGDQFVPGSNWVDAFADSRDTAAIRSDGTLWVSEKPRSAWLQNHYPAPEPPVAMVQFGAESNWQSISRYPTILLKRDGTLWSWGTNDSDNKHYQGLRTFTPQQIPDPTSNWERLLRGAHWDYAWKRDGSAWAVQAEVSRDHKATVHIPNLDNIKRDCPLTARNLVSVAWPANRCRFYRMLYRIAFVTSESIAVAVVLCGREFLKNPYQSLAEIRKLEKTPQLEGYSIMLGTPPLEGLDTDYWGFPPHTKASIERFG